MVLETVGQMVRKMSDMTACLPFAHIHRGVDRLKLSKHFDISDAEAEKMVEQEFWNMQRTNHPHIIKSFASTA